MTYGVDGPSGVGGRPGQVRSGDGIGHKAPNAYCLPVTRRRRWVVRRGDVVVGQVTTDMSEV